MKENWETEEDSGIPGRRAYWNVEKLSIDTILNHFGKYILAVNDDIFKTEDQQPYTIVIGTVINQMNGINFVL